jgi:hypothetical protein
MCHVLASSLISYLSQCRPQIYNKSLIIGVIPSTIKSQLLTISINIYLSIYLYIYIYINAVQFISSSIMCFFQNIPTAFSRYLAAICHCDVGTTAPRLYSVGGQLLVDALQGERELTITSHKYK